METNSAVDAGGTGSVVTSSFLYIVDHLSLADVNQFVITVTSIVGLFYLGFKLRGQITKNKREKLEYDKEKAAFDEKIKTNN